MSDPIKLSDFTLMSTETQLETASRHRSSTSDVPKPIYQTRFDVNTGYFHIELKYVEPRGSDVTDEPVVTMERSQEGREMEAGGEPINIQETE